MRRRKFNGKRLFINLSIVMAMVFAWSINSLGDTNETKAVDGGVISTEPAVYYYTDGRPGIVYEGDDNNDGKGEVVKVVKTVKKPVKKRTKQQVVSRGRTFTATERELLARIVHSEARGEPFKGKVAVAAVVLNRVGDRGSMWKVVFRKNAFTAVQDGQFALTPSDVAYKAADAAIAGQDPTNGAVYYWNPDTATSKWIWTRKITMKIGRHVFGVDPK